jgi:hypothetical protein
MAQDMGKWRAFVNTVMKVLIPKKYGDDFD